MKHLFVMDPLDRIHVSGDSTFVVMRECTDRGHAVAMCTPDALFSLDGQTYGRVTDVKTTAAAPYFHTEPPREASLADFDLVWMRKDPPFDMTYIFTTYLLDMAHTHVVNHPTGLKRFINSKSYMLAPDARSPLEEGLADLIRVLSRC